MNHSAADVIAAARMRVYNRHPYLGHALFALRPVEAPGLGTLAVDAGWRLYYDPEVVASWDEEMVRGKVNRIGGSGEGHDGVAAVVFHELGHVLREHFKRRGGRDPHAWNCAGDREINDDAVQAGWKLPGQPLMPGDVGLGEGLLAEEYYQTPRSVVTSVTLPGCGGKCGGAAGNPTDGELQISGDGPPTRGGRFAPGEGPSAGGPSPLPDPVDAVSQEVVLRRTAAAVAEHVKCRGRGTVPRGLRAWAEAKLEPPRIDWRKRLARSVRAGLMAVAGACDLTWRKSGRRSLYSAGRVGWPIAPALHQPVPRVAVVLDTSGSMGTPRGGRTVQEEALSEVVGIALASGAGVTVYACDASVHAGAVVRSAADLEKVNKGGGGTDMRPGFLAARKGKTDLVVIVTDGIVGDGWPAAEDCRGLKVLAVLVGDGPPEPPGHIPFVKVD